MSNLFNITEDMITLRNQIETENEFSDESSELQELEDKLVIKRRELSTKIESYLHVINQAEAQNDMAIKEINRIQKFAERKTHIATRLKAALLQALLLFGEEDKKGIKRLEIGTIRLSTRRSKSVNILDENEVPEDCKGYDVTFKNLTFDIKNFLANLIQDLPESNSKSTLTGTFNPVVKINKILVKNKLQEEEIDWAELITKYGLTIK